MSRKDLFIQSAVSSSALSFGSFTLKSGRVSPYFFNLGKFCSGGALSSLATCYAQTILEQNIDFDVLFGPAYKGIPLAALAVAKIAELRPEMADLCYAYNRKEVKDHGEGGSLVGASLKGKKVLIIDDVITAGTAAAEAVDLIKAAGGIVAGIVVAVDRQEHLPGSAKSAMQQISANLNIPVFAIVTFSDIISYTKQSLSAAQLEDMQKYKSEYGAEE